MWLTASDPRQSAYRPRTEKAALTLGDQFLFLLAYEAFRQTEVAVTLRNQPVVSTHALIRLAFPEDFSGHLQPVDWTSWFSGDGPLLLEAMQRWLAIRCKATERHKALIISPAEMLACGQTQIDVLGRFLEAAQQNRRPDLARFVLQSLSDLLRGTPETREWTRNLNVGDLRIADRAEVYRAAAAFLRQGERLQAWTAAARGVSFFDREEYVAAQLWLTDWDRWHGDAACQTAADLVRQLDLIRMVSA